MLKVGIVGLHNADVYMKALERLPAFTFCGIYDPSLLIDRYRTYNFNVFQSFTDVYEQCQAVIFSIDDNIYMPLVTESIRHSLDVFLCGVHNFGFDELQTLTQLRDEAGTSLVVGHPYIYTEIYQYLHTYCKQPFDIQCIISRSDNHNLMSLARTEVSMLLAFMRTNVHRVAVNVYSSFSSVPDSLRLRIDFDNGTIGNLVIDKYGITPTHDIKILNYNNITQANLLNNTVTNICSDKPDTPTLWNSKLQNQSIEYQQLKSFYNTIMCGNCLINSIENEIRTQIACEQIRAKMRINFNVF